MQWEQTSSTLAMLSGIQSMMAATHGAKLPPGSVADFMPVGSVNWLKKKKQSTTKAVTDPKIQSMVLKQAFGFR